MRYPMRSSIRDRALWCLALVAVTLLAPPGGAAVRNYAPYPQPDAGYVTDLAGVLSDEQERLLEDWLLKTETARGVEIIVVTIRSIRDYPGTANRDIETFARGLFDAYGVGSMSENNGVLLLVATRDRKARIELGASYGHARDAVANNILNREILPCFRNEDYAKGILQGTRALMDRFGRILLLPWWVRWAVVGAIAGLIPVAISLFRNGKRGWGWVVAGLILVLVLALIWFLRHVVRALPGSGNAPGGLGGFGGGFSGGGGATGSW
jgi:uncharacterized protein